MVSYVCLSSKKKIKISPHFFHWRGREGRDLSRIFVWMLRVFPQHSTFSAGFNWIKNRYLFTNSCSQIRPYATIFKIFRGSRGGGADHCAPPSGVSAMGIPFQIIRLGRSQTLFFCQRLYLENKAVSCDGFRVPVPCGPCPEGPVGFGLTSHKA